MIGPGEFPQHHHHHHPAQRPGQPGEGLTYRVGEEEADVREDTSRRGGGRQALARAHHRLVPEAGLREPRVPQGDEDNSGDAGILLPPGPRAAAGM